MVPGECWAFEGSVGDVVIKLAVPAIVTGFTLEHIPKSVSRYQNIDSAPKHFQVLVRAHIYNFTLWLVFMTMRFLFHL